MDTQPQKSFIKKFWWIGALIILIAVVVFVSVYLKRAGDNKEAGFSQKNSPSVDNNIIKSIGFNLDYYNAATKKAGDMEFFQLPSKLIFMDYGYIITAEETV